MSENRLVGSLVLRTIDIDPTKFGPIQGENEYGIFTALGQYVTWKNVNIRLCCGSLYDKYKQFNLKLTSVQHRHSGTATIDSQYAIYISGFTFSPGSTYNTRNGVTNQSCLGCVNFVSQAATGVTTAVTAGLVTFDKPIFELVNITIDLKNGSFNSPQNGIPEKSSVQLGHWTLVMDIYGVDNDETTTASLQTDSVMSYDKNKQEHLNTPNYLQVGNKSFR